MSTNPYGVTKASLELPEPKVPVPLRIDYQLHFRDYLLFNFLHQFLSPPLQAVYLILAGLMFLDSIGKDGRVVLACIVALVSYCAFWLFHLAFNVVVLYSRRNRALLTTHIVEIQDDAFYEETRFNRSFHYWPGIVKVVNRPGFAAVYINAQAAHIIPGRAFANSAQRAQFVALIRERLISASGSSKDA